ncbi:lipase family protein [Rhodococcus sp. IEGM 1379]|uniref:lipase family protein n=1 Tax=Rhodococcus sp. IEGM 1379 TaxID=3047086 RepID=UPI0024B65EF4|nr:lipase family protein [Rhodococcus sp. IEGM 1379]MDI9916812.1 alpha/beta fold hydrolase [Rhodococcus sp. IEGM 1379]
MRVSKKGVAAAAAMALVLTGCSSQENAGDGQAQIDFGQLLSHQALSGNAVLPSAKRSELITYLSQGPKGESVVVSGSVSIPSGTAPDAGWPVISWAHGTTGVADACAPSSGTVDGPDGEYLKYVGQTLDRYLQAGYVVAQTDYVGLGTPGLHPYVNGDSEANAVVDIVRASRELDSDIGKAWYTAGHSQGGHAALFTAAQGSARAPELQLRGAVAIAPGNNTSQTPQYFAAGGPEVRAALGYLPLILLGAQAADPALDAQDYVADAAKPLVQKAFTSCTGTIDAIAATIPTDQIMKSDANIDALVSYLETQEPAQLRLTVPTLIVQGTGDTAVSEVGSRALAEALCAEGSSVGYRTYEGLEHTPAVPASFEDTIDFFRQLDAGDKSPDLC